MRTLYVSLTYQKVHRHHRHCVLKSWIPAFYDGYYFHVASRHLLLRSRGWMLFTVGDRKRSWMMHIWEAGLKTLFLNGVTVGSHIVERHHVKVLFSCFDHYTSPKIIPTLICVDGCSWCSMHHELYIVPMVTWCKTLVNVETLEKAPNM